MWKSLFADAPSAIRPWSAPPRSAITLSATPQPRPIMPAYGVTAEWDDIVRDLNALTETAITYVEKEVADPSL